MSEELANTVTLWVLLPSMAVLVLVLGAQAVGTPRGVRKRRRERQLADLEQVRAAAGATLEIDRIRYKEIAKDELLERLGSHGWHQVGEQIGEKAWLLRFSLDPTAEQRPDSGRRLAEELANAEPSADGSYVLDTTRYGDLKMEEIGRAAKSAGWKIERATAETPRSNIVLSRPGSTTVEFGDGPFAGSSAPAELRGNPAVRALASEIELKEGFDPLSVSVLDRARERHTYWAKQFNRQVLLAFLYGFVGLFLLAGSFASTAGSSFYLLLGISLIVLALFGVAVLKAVLIRKRRRAEVGGVLDAYERLRRVHE
jgi:hypothetical protein